MRFVDRDLELERLDAMVGRSDGGLAVLWGRRRVGKTRLLLEWSRRHQGLYSVADLSAAAVQRAYVAQALAERFTGFADVAYPDWRSLLRAVSREADRGSWRGPLIIDEVPYLLETSPEVATVLQGWIDHEARKARLVVALCGSAQHMMHELAVGASAPLFGRASVALKVAPMNVAALGDALGLADAVAAVQAYAAWGGIPRYWELAEPFGTSLDHAVDELVLDPMGPLHQEPDRLLAEERPSAVSLRPLLDAIGAGAHRSSEIAGRLGQPATALARPLSRLQELDLVRREQPIGDAERGSKRSLYRLADSFFRMWFGTVAANRGWLASATRAGRLKLWARHAPALVAETWEELCRLAIPGLARAGGPLEGLGGLGPAGRYWRGSGPEWDVVAPSLDGSTLLLGEVKWREGHVERAFVEGAHAELTRKGRPAIASGRDAAVVETVFVPRLPRGWRRRPGGPIVIDAAQVIEAFRRAG